MPDSLEGLRHWLWEHGFQFSCLDYNLSPIAIDLTIETTDMRGTFTFGLHDSTARMAASVLLAFNPNRHLVLPQIYGARSMTMLNPPGAAYDYGPNGVTLDLASLPIPRVRLPGLAALPIVPTIRSKVGPQVRVPAHRDHRFRGIVITQNGAS